MRRLFKLLLLSIGLATATAIAIAGWMAWFATQPVEIDPSPLEFTIKPGSSSKSAARQIVAAGVRMPAWQFEALVRALGKAGEIKAGTYAIASGATPLDLLDKLTSGDVVLSEVVFIEGWTFRQLRRALDAHPEIRHDTAGLPDAEVLARVAPGLAHPEGWFFPDTYRFAKGASDVEILRRAHETMRKRLDAAWATRAPDLPLKDPYEMLILASIIEKETGVGQDRALIGGVFANRLRMGMLLQTDPTIIYGLGEGFDGNLRKRDLTADGPYNTYTRPGLPPTPIALPGADSLAAASRPAETDALYFVARGDGSSEFSRTLTEHNRAVDRYQRGRR